MLKKEEWEMRCLRKMNMYTVRCIYIVYTSKVGYS